MTHGSPEATARIGDCISFCYASLTLLPSADCSDKKFGDRYNPVPIDSTLLFTMSCQGIARASPQSF